MWNGSEHLPANWPSRQQVTERKRYGLHVHEEKEESLIRRMTWLGSHQRPRQKDHPLTCHSPILPLSRAFFSPKFWQTNPTQRAESRGKHNLRAEWDALSHLEHCAERQSCLPSHLPCLPTLHRVLIAFGGISPDWAGPKPQSLCAVTHTPGPRSPLWLWTSRWWSCGLDHRCLKRRRFLTADWISSRA